MKKLALLLVLALPALAAFDRSKFEIKHHKFVLDNGLTVLVHEDHSVPVVAVNVWYHVGSRNERRGKTGFAHLFEHFFFNGSENYRQGFREAMDDLGATNRNGTTNTDRTNFFEDVPISALERTLYLEADRMGFLAGNITQEMLERERGVVQNEKRQGENQPYGRAFPRILETVYPYSHPYSWSTIGSMEDLRAATLDDVKEWYATYYGPNNAVLSLAGDITLERAKEVVTKYFNGIAPGPALARTEEWIPRLDRSIRDEMQDRAPQTRIYRLWHAPAWRDPRTAHLWLTAEVLSGSKSARLDRRLVYEKELVTNVTTLLRDGEIAGMFLVIATVKPGVDASVVEKEIDAIVADLIAKGPTAEEVQRAQNRSLARFVRGMETLGGFGGRSEILAESQTYGGKPDAYLDRLERMATATPGDVQKVAKAWLDTPHYTLRVNPLPPHAAGKTDIDRKVLPALATAPEVTFPAVQRATLSNGLQVMLLERHSTPIVNVAIAADAGYASDPAPKAGLAALTLDVIDEGTTTRDPFRIVDELDALGARISASNTLDQSVLQLQALPMNLGKSLDLFADVALNPAFPQGLVDLSIRQRVARIRQEQAQPTAAALRILPRLLYGQDHAYSKPFTGSGYVATISPLKRTDLAEWHRTWFVPNNSTVIVTGDVTMKELLPQLERVFASWKRGETPKKNLTTVARTAGRRVYLVDKPDAPQSVLIAAHVSEPGGQPDDIAIEGVLRNFGGIATSRLMRNLRLDKHWTYGVRGGLTDARGQRPFVISTAVQTDKTKESILELIKEMKGIAGERPITGEELASAMRNHSLSLPGRFDSLAALENAALNVVNYNYPDDYYAKYASSVLSLTEEQLNAAGKKVVHPDEILWIVVGDLKKVEAGIRELNLGEVVRYSGEM
ncbi:MAG: M16 family metallopeptidase [Thermoanaerobaculia bacterium]